MNDSSMELLMSNGLRQVMQSDALIDSRRKKYRCKECGNWVYKKTSRKNTCVDCREEYLEVNNEGCTKF